jgi:hypothetical protein
MVIPSLEYIGSRVFKTTVSKVVVDSDLAVLFTPRRHPSFGRAERILAGTDCWMMTLCWVTGLAEGLSESVRERASTCVKDGLKSGYGGVFCLHIGRYNRQFTS